MNNEFPPITLLAGISNKDQTIFHRLRHSLGDMAAWIGGLPEGELVLVRDIEMEMTRRHARVERVGCPADFAPAEGLSGDRDTAMAQAVTECLRQNGVETVRTDRTLPFLFAAHLQTAGISLVYDPELGVRERRVKDAEEIAALRKVQGVTHDMMRRACGWIAGADVDDAGQLVDAGGVLTSERVRRQVDHWFMEAGMQNRDGYIVASTPEVALCHHRGAGPIRTGEAVVIDLFPRDPETGYNGDCTRTVVHGTPTPEYIRMHEAVVAAKAAGCAALRPGVTGGEVHAAVVAVLMAHGFVHDRSPEDLAVPHMPHGTGHGIGLDVHEPILLDEGAGEILAGEVFTVEPGLYSSVLGGVRVEDMVLVTADGCEVFGELAEGWNWG